MAFKIDCIHFKGDRPCHHHEPCPTVCPDYQSFSHRILVIHLEALGAVLRATSLLPAIRRLYPESHVTWITQSPADQLLHHNPYIDRILTTNHSDLLEIEGREYDVAFVVDKSLKATGLVRKIKCKNIFGFKSDPYTGAIFPATSAAEELWQIGLSNQKKFFLNRKPETQLLIESLQLGPFRRDPYILQMSEEERSAALIRKKDWGDKGRFQVVGLNTGCSSTIPYKKMTVQKHRELIFLLQSNLKGKIKIVLLGGSEDTVRNRAIADGLDVIQSPTDRGLRDGIMSVEACDAIITGDSLGMHIGIALKKWVVAWFGPTCAHEIDFYDRGVGILSPVACAPCWRRSCDRQKMCHDQVPLDQFVEGLHLGLKITNQTAQEEIKINEKFFSLSI